MPQVSDGEVRPTSRATARRRARATAERRRFAVRRRPLAGLVLVAVVAAIFFIGRASVGSGQPGTVLASLAVSECPTTYGAFAVRPTAYPARIALELPAALVGQLAFYSDATRSLEPVLGPAGWTCTVGVGADGTTGVDLVPPPSSPTSATAVPAASSPESVIVLSAASCDGCIYSEICPYVSTAAQQLGLFEVTCPTSRAPEENISWLTGNPRSSQPVKDTIAFDDPPTVKGIGDGSGGVNPSQGVLIYEYNAPSKAGTNLGLSKETCTLPVSDEELCTAMVGNFVDRNWMLPS